MRRLTTEQRETLIAHLGQFRPSVHKLRDEHMRQLRDQDLVDLLQYCTLVVAASRPTSSRSTPATAPQPTAAQLRVAHCDELRRVATAYGANALVTAIAEASGDSPQHVQATVRGLEALVARAADVGVTPAQVLEGALIPPPPAMKGVAPAAAAAPVAAQREPAGDGVPAFPDTTAAIRTAREAEAARRKATKQGGRR